MIINDEDRETWLSYPDSYPVLAGAAPQYHAWNHPLITLPTTLGCIKIIGAPGLPLCTGKPDPTPWGLHTVVFVS